MKNLLKKLVLLTLLVSVVVSCTKKEDHDNKGEVNVKLTDAPFPFGFVSEANVGIAKIELKNSEGTYVTVFDASVSGTATYNLIDYSNGATADVATNDIEAGTYTHAKVTLGEASVKMNGNINDGETGNTIFNNFGASATSSYEFPINPQLEVEDDVDSNLLIDVDVNQTFQFTTAGIPFGDWINFITQIAGCSFNPSIRVCDLDKTGAITGKVTVEGNAAENAYVYVTVDGKEITTHTKEDGTYTFIGIHDGDYQLKVSVEGQAIKKQDITITGTETVTSDFTFL
jgi:hypothetical protein